ncbi:MAG: 1-(5-phosphoribosyl)-5-[(5-phosphoribosylamino)methylideneamino]imidazole-4-carboxamide isomerase [Clostridia bacterium]|nr:1-(5-phosphoribosyl)-5-[(5-phosphoribosylamino)methylideneamino]imidazole-4-carboxamide isomerase [Clostridia bacterium]
MNIFPAIDLFDGKAVRLFKGDYNEMTVYSENPPELCRDFEESGAKFLHIVDLEGAKTGETPNIEVVKEIIKSTNLFTEIGGGIRDMETVEKYIDAGIGRVILGTAAVKDPEFLKEALKKYKDKIAVGVDIKDGKVAIKGWTEKSELDGEEFCKEMQDLGVKTIICTDISKDGAMMGTNHELYERLQKNLNIDIVASGGVSTIEDVKRLRSKDLYGCIIGKAYYTGAINLKDAIEEAK